MSKGMTKEDKIKEIQELLKNCDLEMAYYHTYEPHSYREISELQSTIFKLEDELKDWMYEA